MTRQAKKAAGINKSVHIEVHNSVHKKLRALLFLKEMSLQAFFRLMAESFVNGDEYIEKLVDQLINEHSNEWERFCSGDTKVQGFFVGQIMKSTSGQADGKIINQILNERATSK